MRDWRAGGLARDCESLSLNISISVSHTYFSPLTCSWFARHRSLPLSYLLSGLVEMASTIKGAGAVDRNMLTAVEAMQAKRWTHLKIGLGNANPFRRNIEHVHPGSRDGIYRGTRIILPQYFVHVTRSVSVASLRANVQNGAYATYDEFLDDVRTLKANATAYNGQDDPVTRASSELVDIALLHRPLPNSVTTAKKRDHSALCFGRGLVGDGLGKKLKHSPMNMPPPHCATSSAGAHCGTVSHGEESQNADENDSEGSEDTAAIERAAKEQLWHDIQQTASNNLVHGRVGPTTKDISDVVNGRIFLTKHKAIITALQNLNTLCQSALTINAVTLSRTTVSTLKDLLQLLNLSRSGKKGILCDRLVAHFEALTQRESLIYAWGGACCKDESSRCGEAASPSHAMMACLSTKFDLVKLGGLLPNLLFKHTQWSAMVQRIQLMGAGVQCHLCSIDYIALNDMTRCTECKEWGHVRCLQPEHVPERAFSSLQDEPFEEIVCAKCKCQGDPMLRVISSLCPIQLLDKRDAAAKSFTFSLTSTKNKELSTDERIYLRLFSVQSNPENPGLRFHDCNGLAMNINNTTTVLVRNDSLRSLPPPCLVLKHVNGDIDITDYVNTESEGSNILRIALSGGDTLQFARRVYCCVQVVAKRTDEELTQSFKTVTFEESKQWVQHFFAGNSEDGVSMSISHAIMSLRCPLSCARLVTPARTSACKHLQCFDLKTFLTFNRGSKRALKCPLCSVRIPSSMFTLQICGFTQKVLDDMSKVENVLVKDDGSFQAHNGDETITLSSDEKGESGKKVALPVIDTSCESEDDDLAELLQTLIDQRTTINEPVDMAATSSIVSQSSTVHRTGTAENPIEL